MEVILQAQYDTTILSNGANKNYNTLGALYVGEPYEAETYVGRSIIKFDLSSIPSGAVINSAVLSLYTIYDDAFYGRIMRFYKLLRDYVPTQVTWNSWKTGSAWSSAGAFGAADCEQTDLGNVQLLSDQTGWVDIPFDTAEFQEWTSGAQANYGGLLKMDVESNDLYKFGSLEYTEGYRPKLTVNYGIPKILAINEIPIEDVKTINGETSYEYKSIQGIS